MLDHKFTSAQILFAIATWKLEPLTLKELNFLITFLIPADYPDTELETFYYGENDIESLILQLISHGHKKLPSPCEK